MLLYEDEWGNGINGQQFLTSAVDMCGWRFLTVMGAITCFSLEPGRVQQMFSSCCSYW